jgi:hypothetical protein
MAILYCDLTVFEYFVGGVCIVVVCLFVFFVWDGVFRTEFFVV